MTVQELNNRFEKTINDLKSNAFGNIMAGVGSDALYKIRERVKKTGTDADGQKYPAYSTKPMLSGCKNFLNKGNCPAKTKSARKEMKWVTIQRNGVNYRLYEIPGGYKEFREMNNRQTGFVDFSFSNRMWDNIKLVSNEGEHSKGIARIAATTPEDNDKLAGNTKRKGEILMLSKKEINELSVSLNEQIAELFHKNGL